MFWYLNLKYNVAHVEVTNRKGCDATIYLRSYSLLSVETHRRAATGNTKSREVAGALAGTAPSSTAHNIITRPEIPENVGCAT